MATETTVKDFTAKQLTDMSNQLYEIKKVYEGAAEQAAAASAIFLWFGLIGVPGAWLIPFELLTTVFGFYYSSFISTIDTAIRQIEEYEDFLQNSSYFDMVRMRLTVKKVTHEGTTYLIPVKFETIAVHQKNPPKWVYLN